MIIEFNQGDMMINQSYGQSLLFSTIKKDGLYICTVSGPEVKTANGTYTVSKSSVDELIKELKKHVSPQKDFIWHGVAEAINDLVH